MANVFKKILVTGGAGYIGSHLVPLLLDHNYSVRVFDNLLFNQKIPHHLINNPNYEFLKADIRDETSFNQALKDVDLIIHLAALVGEPACRKYRDVCYETNRDAVKIINKLRDDRPLIIASSTSVYGETGGGLCSEETMPTPTLDYSISKYEAENIVRARNNFIILRPATAFGYSYRPRLDLLINEFVFKAIKEKKLEIYNPNLMRTFVHVKDLARVFLMMAENFYLFKNQIFNVGSENLNLTKAEIGQAIKEHVDYDLKMVQVVDDPDQRNFVVNYDKIKNAGFVMNTSLYLGIKEMVDKFKNLENDPSFYNINFV
ncbi:MAG: NAD(P)-dependent oxidoreductase [bacterium]|nr:NAD(P)-dependent oxidoreductase [bacterium]